MVAFVAVALHPACRGIPSLLVADHITGVWLQHSARLLATQVGLLADIRAILIAIRSHNAIVCSSCVFRLVFASATANRHRIVHVP